MMSTSARAAALLTAALLVGSSATAAMAAAGEQVRTSTVTAGGQVRTSTVAAGEPVSTSTAAAITMTSTRKPKRAKGFHVVAELPHEVQALVSPAKGELWLAAQPDDHTVQLDHLRAGRWTTETSAVDAGGTAFLTGTRSDDVWLAVGTSLRRYDGSRWTTVALPARDSCTGPWWDITAVVSPRRGVFYAALSSNGGQGSSQVLRYARGG